MTATPRLHPVGRAARVLIGLLARRGDEIVRDGRELAAIAPNVVVKIPTMVEGLAATRALADEGIPVNMTLCFSVPQAIMAARAGARYISPFVGRFDDHNAEIHWLGKLDSGSLKIKVASSIVAISSIHLLQVFLNAREYTDSQIMWQVIMHVTFVVSALMLGVLDKIMAKH